jgi:hypothetical protein
VGEQGLDFTGGEKDHPDTQHFRFLGCGRSGESLHEKHFRRMARGRATDADLQEGMDPTRYSMAPNGCERKE